MRENDAPFTLRVQAREGSVTIVPQGELDRSTAPTVTAALEQHRGSDIVVDLSHVVFADSSLVRALVEERHHARLAGRSFSVTGADPRVRRSFAVSGADDLFVWD